MANQFHNEKIAKDTVQINNLLDDSPDCLKTYIRSLHDLQTSSKLEYIRNLRQFLDYIVDSDTDNDLHSINEITTDILGNLTVDDINSYIEYQKYYIKNGKEYVNSPATIKRKIAALRGFYSYLVNTDKIIKNPMLKIKSPSVKEKNIVRLEKDEEKEYMDTVLYGIQTSNNMEKMFHEKQKKRDYTIIYLFLHTGMRVSELVGLNKKDLFLKHHYINVLRKGGKEARIYISDYTENVLKEYLIYRDTIEPIEKDEDALFLSNRRQRISIRAVQALVEKYTSGTEGLNKNITCHKFRSTFATNAFRACSDLYLVADILGHSSVETTKKHYAQLTNEHKEENRDLL